MMVWGALLFVFLLVVRAFARSRGVRLALLIAAGVTGALVIGVFVLLGMATSR